LYFPPIIKTIEFTKSNILLICFFVKDLSMTVLRSAPLVLAATLLLHAGSAVSQSAAKPTLSEARKGYTTKIVRKGELEPAVPVPPKDVFNLIRFDARAGKLAAYVTPNPGDGKRHPAIVWITGGDSNSIGEMWTARPRADDQSAAAYRKAGIVTMFPSLRGGNDNPGRREGFYGEVDDVIAAAAYLAKLPYVDPSRIYLGGHSTGGTLVMLVAETTNRFRATFAFGPVGTPLDYGNWALFHAPGDQKEGWLRSPIFWLDSVNSPLFVIEGLMNGNAGDLAAMQRANRNGNIRFIPVEKKGHVSVLAPANELIASRILAQPAIPAAQLLTVNDARLIGER
jgi:dipeptidyl aminopeptidase/acylaminoacyl peptidase